MQLHVSLNLVDGRSSARRWLSAALAASASTCSPAACERADLWRRRVSALTQMTPGCFTNVPLCVTFSCILLYRYDQFALSFVWGGGLPLNFSQSITIVSRIDDRAHAIKRTRVSAPLSHAALSGPDCNRNVLILLIQEMLLKQIRVCGCTFGCLFKIA